MRNMEKKNMPRNEFSTFITRSYPFRLVRIFTWDNAVGILVDGRRKE